MTRQDQKQKHSAKTQEQQLLDKFPLFSSTELVLVKKDLHAIWGRKGIRALLMAMPAVLVMVIPIVYAALISLLPVTESSPPEVLSALLSAETAGHGYRQFWMDAFATLLCPMLFICVPIVCSIGAASCVFVGEKENRTLETLMLTPMGSRAVFNAKIIVCVLVSAAISLISFIVFAITMSVADIVISAPYFFSLEWLVTLFLLMPAVTLFSVVFVTLSMRKVHSVGESLQTMGYVILPFAVLYLLQFTGVYRIDTGFLVMLVILLFLAAIILFNVSSRRFQADLLLSRSGRA